MYSFKNYVLTSYYVSACIGHWLLRGEQDQCTQSVFMGPWSTGRDEFTKGKYITKSTELRLCCVPPRWACIGAATLTPFSSLTNSSTPLSFPIFKTHLAHLGSAAQWVDSAFPRLWGDTHLTGIAIRLCDSFPDEQATHVYPGTRLLWEHSATWQ